MIKEDLLQFLKNDNEFDFDFDYYYWELLEKTINKFFEQYQPERLNEKTSKEDAIV
jgi:hypothetical protein